MAADTRSHGERAADAVGRDSPEIAVRESCPGRSVFVESGNADGWIATDLTVDIRQ